MQRRKALPILTFLGIILFLAPLPLAAQNSEARILEMNGRVEIKAPGDETWRAARPGITLTRETLISTGFRSGAILGLGNSRLTVRALTRLSLADLLLSQNQETISVNLRVGRVRAEVNPPPGGRVDFAVRSPSATASVRGTVFEFDTVAVRVDEGSVRLAPAAPSAGPARASSPRSVTINAGQTSQMDTLTGRAPPPRAIAVLAPPPIAGTISQITADPGTPAPIIETGPGSSAEPTPGGTVDPPPVTPPPPPPNTPGMGTVGIEVEWKD